MWRNISAKCENWRYMWTNSSKCETKNVSLNILNVSHLEVLFHMPHVPLKATYPLTYFILQQYVVSFEHIFSHEMSILLTLCQNIFSRHHQPQTIISNTNIYKWHQGPIINWLCTIYSSWRKCSLYGGRVIYSPCVTSSLTGVCLYTDSHIHFIEHL